MDTEYKLCQSPAVSEKLRWRLHGGAPRSGGPKGPSNGRYRHGLRTAEATAEWVELRALIRRAGEFVDGL